MDYTIHSKYLKEFIEEIKYKNRNPDKIKALELLDEKETNPEIIFYPDDKIYRSRIIYGKDRINREPGFFGYSSKESFIAPKEKTRDYRANYRYIPYLYCSSHPYTALLEVRPRLGARVSIATIQINEQMSILDFTLRKVTKKMSPPKINLFKDLSSLFSIPVTDEDDISDYIPTQFIAEYAKKLGYDGIAFKSSLMPEIDDFNSYLNNHCDRYNIVIFNYNKCSPIKSNEVQITRHYLECEQVDGDSQHLDIKPLFLEMLEDL